MTLNFHKDVSLSQVQLTIDHRLAKQIAQDTRNIVEKGELRKFELLILLASGHLKTIVNLDGSDIDAQEGRIALIDIVRTTYENATGKPIGDLFYRAANLYIANGPEGLKARQY